MRSSPRVHEVAWLPGSLTQWADLHGVARNAVAFGGFAFVTAFGVRQATSCFIIYLDVIALSAIAEVAQIWIPTRSSDLNDVWAAAAGVAIAALLHGLGACVRRKER